MKTFSETLTEPITIWNLKHGILQWKVFDNDDILYIVEKVLKNAIQW